MGDAMPVVDFAQRVVALNNYARIINTEQHPANKDPDIFYRGSYSFNTAEGVGTFVGKVLERRFLGCLCCGFHYNEHSDLEAVAKMQEKAKSILGNRGVVLGESDLRSLGPFGMAIVEKLDLEAIVRSIGQLAMVTTFVTGGSVFRYIYTKGSTTTVAADRNDLQHYGQPLPQEAIIEALARI